MTKPKIDSVLKKCHLFAELDPRSISGIAALASEKSLADGEILFSEGDEAAFLFILESGAIDLVKYSSEGRERLVRSVSPVEIFAEAAVFSGEEYPATAVARKDSRVVAIRKDRLSSFIRKHPDVSMKMMGVMSSLLRHLNSLLSELSLDSVEARLAAYFVKRARKQGAEFFLGMQKRELASRLGTVPETFSRNLKKFLKAGFLQISGGKVKILNIKELSRIASGCKKSEN
ncbi:MAG: Crp/Fnr family transcriptional regulator [Myxococcales bacterium]|nr:Crp/Fnr family transcriptional regulator [Myxococcales bacterium]